MFKNLDFDSEHPKRPVVPADAKGDDLLKIVVDYAFIIGFNESGSEAVSVMTRCGFIPLGIAADGADGNNDTLYVLINERNAALPVTPYIPVDIRRNLTAVLAEKVHQELAVKLVRVESSVVNRVIDFIYYRVEIDDSAIDETEVTKPLSVDVQPGETGVIMQARAWFREALNRGASDIHVEPMDNGVGRIRLRVNGILENLQRRIPVGDLVQIVTWVKAQSRMDISEKRKPLDGSVRIS